MIRSRELTVWVVQISLSFRVSLSTFNDIRRRKQHALCSRMWRTCTTTTAIPCGPPVVVYAFGRFFLIFFYTRILKVSRWYRPTCYDYYTRFNRMRSRVRPVTIMTFIFRSDRPKKHNLFVEREINAQNAYSVTLPFAYTYGYHISADCPKHVSKTDPVEEILFIISFNSVFTYKKRSQGEKCNSRTVSSQNRVLFSMVNSQTG